MDRTKPLDVAVLLSGGIDSTALTYLLRPRYAITVDYGQNVAQAEITASKVVCDELSIQHEIIRIDCSMLGAGNMVSGRTHPETGGTVSIAPTPEWWPFRNQLIITFAAARAVALGLRELAIGTVKTDRDHRDGLPEFFDTMDRLLTMQEGELRVRAPAADMGSFELVRLSKIPISLLAWSHSCHCSVYSCGSCRGCVKHERVFADLDKVNHQRP